MPGSSGRPTAPAPMRCPDSSTCTCAHGYASVGPPSGCACWTATATTTLGLTGQRAARPVPCRRRARATGARRPCRRPASARGVAPGQRRLGELDERTAVRFVVGGAWRRVPAGDRAGSQPDHVARSGQGECERASAGPCGGPAGIGRCQGDRRRSRCTSVRWTRSRDRRFALGSIRRRSVWCLAMFRSPSKRERIDEIGVGHRRVAVTPLARAIWCACAWVTAWCSTPPIAPSTCHVSVDMVSAGSFTGATAAPVRSAPAVTNHAGTSLRRRRPAGRGPGSA